MREQVALKEKRNTGELLVLLFAILIVIAATLAAFREERLWLHLCFVVPERPGGGQPSIFNLVWKVIVTDLMARFLSIACKICVALCLCGAPHRRLRQVYRLLEMLVVVYRSVLPSPQWYFWLLAANSSSHLFSSLVTGLYLTFKLAAVIDQLRTVSTICRSTLLQHSVRGSRRKLRERESGAREWESGARAHIRLVSMPPAYRSWAVRTCVPRALVLPCALCHRSARSSMADMRQRRTWRKAQMRRARSATTTSTAR